MLDECIRRTKIVATLGPATDTQEAINAILDAGVNVVRMNFSHGSHNDHLQRMNYVREYSKKNDKIIGILADLQGPKIRVASFKEGKVTLQDGASFTLDAALGENDGDSGKVGIDYKELPQDVEPGDILLLDDGRISMSVVSIKGAEVVCKVVSGGILSNHKGINKKGGGLTAKALTEKDCEDLIFAVNNGVDFVAISFPRNAEDIREAQRLVAAEAVVHPPAVIAKIERAEAIDVLDDIIIASDGVMVARGDLAVEIGDAEVPLVQKDIIQRARSLDKPVIVATQMMESMIENNVPTRAEVSDVANAVLDNTDAIMLSAETAAGQYPVEAVLAMDRVCRRVEQQPRTQVSNHRLEMQFSRIDESIAMATMYVANHLRIRAVIALTETGATTLKMSRIRTALPIYGLCRYPRALGRMTLYRGVYPIAFDVMSHEDLEINKAAVNVLLNYEFIKEGELVVLTKGDHHGVGGSTNAMEILIVSEVAE